MRREFLRCRVGILRCWSGGNGGVGRPLVGGMDNRGWLAIRRWGTGPRLADQYHYAGHDWGAAERVGSAVKLIIKLVAIFAIIYVFMGSVSGVLDDGDTLAQLSVALPWFFIVVPVAYTIWRIDW